MSSNVLLPGALKVGGCIITASIESSMLAGGRTTFLEIPVVPNTCTYSLSGIAKCRLQGMQVASLFSSLNLKGAPMLFHCWQVMLLQASEVSPAVWQCTAYRSWAP